MYLHLGQDTVITAESIVAMFDIDACTVSKKTRDFLANAEKSGKVINVSYELPKSFIVCEKKAKRQFTLRSFQLKQSLQEETHLQEIFSCIHRLNFKQVKM